MMNETKTTVERPAIATDEYLEYLDAFDLSRLDASATLAYWMQSFSERHP